MGKVLYFLIYLALALHAYYKKNRSFISKHSFIISWFLVVVRFIKIKDIKILMIPVYDLGVPHVIKVLYVMMLASSYGTFLMLHYLVNN